MKEAKDVYVYAEQRDGQILKVAFELLGAGKSLADDLGGDLHAILLGSGIKDQAQQLISYGAQDVVIVDAPELEEYALEPYTTAMAKVLEETAPEIVLFGATAIGRDLAPRLAARVHTGLTADCTVLQIDPETKNLLMTRPAYGGNLLATIICPEYRPQMATVRPGVMQPLEKDASRTGTTREITVDFTGTDTVEILEVHKEKKNIADITAAKVIVAGGRGMGGKQNFEKLQTLADSLGGAVAASRAAVEAGWADVEVQVGQTGKTVRPKLYIACGISGAIQHTAGMDGSEYVLAINSDVRAPISEVSDLTVVGNANEIVPLLVKEIEAHAEKNSIK